MTTEQRSKIMASIHSKDTKPEMAVRRYLFACGFRYRVNSRRLPGTPDIVLRKYRTCIFVNGCFWHGHDNCRNYRLPKTNVEFWSRKIARNKQRDAEVRHRLARMGWHVMTIWECQLDTKEKRESTLMRIEHTLNHIYLTDITANRTPADVSAPHEAMGQPSGQMAGRPYVLPGSQDVSMAAEDPPSQRQS